MSSVPTQDARLLANDVPLVDGESNSVGLMFLLLDGAPFAVDAEAVLEHGFYVHWLGAELGVQLALGDTITLLSAGGEQVRQSRVGESIARRPATDEVL
ncbi:hypothetical protein [Rugamonas aquatica]|uniref:Uncharacterized protein n=1 Tax=Rugamonas aquatica TaxID=2743357 RepID=A0A6A7N6B3_9BURK|nr:hypothetical protein [Rugamonas aquatica]MQA40633.1 hypothetical protein [Rugamonas aquatica]